jgi:hypothetical protein
MAKKKKKKATTRRLFEPSWLKFMSLEAYMRLKKLRNLKKAMVSADA